MDNFSSNADNPIVLSPENFMKELVSLGTNVMIGYSMHLNSVAFTLNTAEINLIA
jgi:hypothetical protein